MRIKCFFAFAAFLTVLTVDVTSADIGMPTSPYTEGQYSTSTVLTFKWGKGSVGEKVTGFWFQVGTTPGSYNIFDGNVGMEIGRAHV